MNILVASVDSFPRMGGISTMAHHLANSFQREGHEVVFLGPKGSYVPRDHVRDYQLLEDHDSEVRDRSGEKGIIQDRRIEGLVHRVIQRYDINRVLLVHPFYYAIGSIDACATSGVPCSVYFHGFELRSQLTGGYPKNQSALIRNRVVGTLRERVFYTIGRADEVLVNSSYTGGLLDGFQVKPPVRVTGCGIPVSDLEREVHLSRQYKADERAKRRKQAAFPAGLTMAFVGRLVPTKGVDRLIDLCRLAPTLNALIIGTGPEREALERRATKLGVRDRIHFLGEVSEAEKWAALRAADFLCLLSRPDDAKGQVEGFGIALLEGAACGAVPVSSGTGGMRDVVKNDDTGLILPADDRAAADLLVKTASEETHMQRLSHSARQQLRKRYTWEAVAQRITSEW